ncbi:hypothetical protein NLJ89_g4798 [Agrocybe chaxingu]|uniref:BTB domain-containing protein n=1 Tax=Agrocybe chaxingu TaxID=84603 RepID=A0A9W8MW73_9AGAR|nr:hypothetical protein NLJ89_g4798 [Agrocybe chaxingu]
MSSDTSQTNHSNLFNDPSADITFQSSDGTLFQIHSAALKWTSRGFAVPEDTTLDHTPIPLQESAETLEILFQFIHPREESQNFRQPDLRAMETGLFFRFAEAAEKYVVFGATTSCVLHMHQLVMEHPLEILSHAHKHGYPDLADKVAVHTLGFPDSEAARKLSAPGLLGEWATYVPQPLDGCYLTDA